MAHLARIEPHTAEPVKLTIVAANDFGEYTLSSPAVSEGQLFIRTDKALYAIGRRTTSTD